MAVVWYGAIAWSVAVALTPEELAGDGLINGGCGKEALVLGRRRVLGRRGTHDRRYRRRAHELERLHYRRQPRGLRPGRIRQPARSVRAAPSALQNALCRRARDRTVELHFPAVRADDTGMAHQLRQLCRGRRLPCSFRSPSWPSAEANPTCPVPTGCAIRGSSACRRSCWALGLLCLFMPFSPSRPGLASGMGHRAGLGYGRPAGVAHPPENRIVLHPSTLSVSNGGTEYMKCAIARLKFLSLAASLSLFCLGMLPGLFPTPAAAQAREAGAEEAVIEEIVVIGSRKRGRSAAESTAPIDVISGETFGLVGNTADITENLRVNVPSYNASMASGDGDTFVRPTSLRGPGSGPDARDGERQTPAPGRPDRGICAFPPERAPTARTSECFPLSRSSASRCCATGRRRNTAPTRLRA